MLHLLINTFEYINENTHTSIYSCPLKTHHFSDVLDVLNIKRFFKYVYTYICASTVVAILGPSTSRDD